MIKVFIGHFTWLPNNPYVFAGARHNLGKAECWCSGRWILAGRRQEEPRVGEVSGTR